MKVTKNGWAAIDTYMSRPFILYENDYPMIFITDEKPKIVRGGESLVMRPVTITIEYGKNK